MAGVALVVFLGSPLVAVVSPHGPRLIWTVLIASLPLLWVVGGLHLWRRICPLARLATLPARLGLGGTRRLEAAGRWLWVPASLMLFSLCMRLWVTNGTPWALAAFLLVVMLGAVVSGVIWRGRSWCHRICPVGPVELLYTQPAELISSGNAQCSPCTACVKNCSDIDLEQSYWKAERGTWRRTFAYAWPGVVLGFYGAFALRTGSFDDYFSGAWTRRAESLETLVARAEGPLPLPWVVLVPLTLGLAGALSYGLFDLAERALSRRAVGDAARLQLAHRGLALAAFAGFLCFYAFAGQPTLRLAPEAMRWAVGVVVIVAATLVLVRRWDRTEPEFVRERFAQRLLKRWEWGDDVGAFRAGELVRVHEERTRARQERVAAWRDTLQELLAEGTLHRAHLAALEALRRQLGVSEEEQARVLAGLSEADRQRLDRPDSVERSLQQRQHEAALEAVLAQAVARGEQVEPGRLEQLRLRYGLDPAEHQAVLERLRSPEAALARSVAEALQRLRGIAGLAAAARGNLTGPDARLVEAICRHEAGPLLTAVEGWLRGMGADGSSALAQGVAEVQEQLAGGAAGLDAAEALRDDPSRWLRLGAALTRSLAGQSVDEDPDPLVRLAAGAPGWLSLSTTDPDLLTRLRLLHGVELFRGLSPESVLQLAHHARCRRLGDAERLCDQGEPGDEMFLVLAGEIVASRSSTDGREILRRFGPGECVGELAVIEPAPRSARLESRGDSVVLAVAGAPVRALLAERPEMAQAVLRELARRLRG